MVKEEEKVVGVASPSSGDDEVENRLQKGQYLPHIHRIKLPETRTKSALIRWLWLLGYEVKVISKGLDIRYQQVRNIITTDPKRAAREDLPPLEIQLLEAEDVVDMLLGDALEADFAAARKAERKKHRNDEVEDEEE